MLHLVEAIKTFISQMGVSKGTFSKDLDYMNQKFERRKVKKIQKCIDMLAKYDITYDTRMPENNKPYLNILLLIRKQPKSIEFLTQTSLEDCRRLQELPGLFDNGFLSVNDILDLEKCIDFMQKFVNAQPMNKLKDIDLINKFKEEVDKNKDINFHFTRFINNFAIINEMIKNGLDRAEMSKNKVSLILQKSEITISNNKDKFFNCFYFDENRNNENDLIPSNLSLKDLFDLRDRAQLNRVVITQGDNNAQEKEQIITRVTGTTVRHINASALSEVVIKLPTDKVEQKKIADYLQTLDSQISLQTQRLEKLKQIKSACLDNMFV
jgi:hypothetical protein